MVDGLDSHEELIPGWKDHGKPTWSFNVELRKAPPGTLWKAGFRVLVRFDPGLEISCFFGPDTLREGKDEIVSELIARGAPAPLSSWVAVTVLGKVEEDGPDICGRCGGFRLDVGICSAACGVCAVRRLDEAESEGVDIEDGVLIMDTEKMVEKVMDA